MVVPKLSSNLGASSHVVPRSAASPPSRVAVCCSLLRVSLPIITCILTASAPAHAELITVSRNTLLFVDAAKEGGEWAAYRVVDPEHPGIFRAEGPAHVVLRVRTFASEARREPSEDPSPGGAEGPGGTAPREDARPAVAAILSDGRIVLTARVEPVRDPSARLVEDRGRSVSPARVYVVRIGPGLHTVTIRHSEGPALLVAGAHVEGTGGQAAGAEDVPLAAPPRAARVQRIDALSLSELPPEPGAPPESEAGSVDPTRTAEPEGAGDPLPEGTLDALQSREAWEDVPSRRAARSAPSATPAEHDPGAAAGSRGDRDRADPAPPPPNGPEHDADPRGTPALPAAASRPARRLTTNAPWLLWELFAGTSVSSAGLDPGAILGLELRAPIPGLDARRFSAGVSVAGGYARGDSIIRGQRDRLPIDLARLEHLSLSVAADLRVALGAPGGLDPYASAGGAIITGTLRADDGETERSGEMLGGALAVRLGAAFGGSSAPEGWSTGRPFFELRGAIGRLGAGLPRADGSTSVTHLELGAVVGYRIELLTEADAD